jgi:hypothetical protein
MVSTNATGPAGLFTGCCVIGNESRGASRGFTATNSLFLNNTAYNNSVASVQTNGGVNRLYNNILIPAVGGKVATINSDSTIISDYNCYVDTAGNVIAVPFDSNSSSNPTINGQHDIEADPLFALAGNDFRLLPGSPCLNTGMPTQYGYSSRGAWQQKQRGSR